MTEVHTLYYGATDSPYLPDVLRSAGYAVEECESVGELVRLLKSEQKTDLVCVAETWDRPAEGALAAARAFTEAPIVLFRSSNHHYLQQVWDLEIPPLTNPSEWLVDVAELLDETRPNGAQPPGLQAESRHLRERITRMRPRSTDPEREVRSQARR